MSAEQPGVWPLEAAEFEAWTQSVEWIDAVTAVMNPHQYCLKRRCPSPRQFEMMVLHIREFGHQEWFGGREYTYLESGGWKYWTMMEPLEWTILVNRKKLPGEDEQEAQPSMSETLPDLYTSRYMAYDVLSSGLVVPVRVSMLPPEPLLGPLPYPLEHALRDLMPERPMYGDWRTFSPLFWKKLEHIGVAKIAAQLAALSARHEGKALALLCFEDLPKGQMCHRTIVAAWIGDATGQAVPELTDTGEVLQLHQLHPQIQPMRPR